MYFKFIKTNLFSLMILCFGHGATINILASTTDLAAIASEIGKEHVSVTSIARGNQDPHFIEVLPSFMLTAKRADIYLKVGMELDLWAEGIIRGSRNRSLKVVDCSQSVRALEVPEAPVNASMGDIHKFGNPHYWLDPENGILIAKLIADALIEKDPANESFYTANLQNFTKDVGIAIEKWKTEYGHLKGLKILYYHNTWPYFNSRFGLVPVGYVEPVPGIMPTPSHTEELVSMIKDQNIEILAIEPYFSDTAPKYLRSKTGINILKLAPSTGAFPGIDSYLDLFQYNLDVLNGAVH